MPQEDDDEIPVVRVKKDALDLTMTFAVIGIFIILALGVVYTMSSILIPVTLAIVTGMILGMAAEKLGRWGLSPLFSALILSSLVAIGLFLTVNALAEPLAKLATDAPAMAETAMDRILPFFQRFKWLNITPNSFRSGPMSIEGLLQNTGSILSVVAGSLTPAIVQGMIFFAALLLFLAGRLHLRKALIMAFPSRDQRLAAIRVINAIEAALGFYFATATVIYGMLGVVMALIAFLSGMSVPILWGLFAFLSCFVPFVGIFVMTLSVAAAGILTHDTLLIGLAPAAIFFTVHLIVENIVTPSVMGRRLEINPFLVFIAILFWTWMWGAVGAMLALPLSLIVMTLVDELLIDERPMPHLP
jgi:predicted PurR-regulated permease PerM